MYIGLEETEQDFPTPDWLQAHCEANGGGWAIALRVGAGHPVLVSPEDWPCFRCGDAVEEGDCVIPMPWGGGRDKDDHARWILEHRECFVEGIITDPAEKVKCRPPGYEAMPPDRQWKVDKRLKVLDYDPDAKPVFGSALTRQKRGHSFGVSSERTSGTRRLRSPSRLTCGRT